MLRLEAQLESRASAGAASSSAHVCSPACRTSPHEHVHCSKIRAFTRHGTVYMHTCTVAAPSTVAHTLLSAIQSPCHVAAGQASPTPSTGPLDFRTKPVLDNLPLSSCSNPFSRLGMALHQPSSQPSHAQSRSSRRPARRADVGACCASRLAATAPIPCPTRD